MAREARPDVRLLADILSDPAILAAPVPIVARLAWPGRATLLAAPEKCGKSTLATAAAATVSTGRPWLGEPTRSGPVLWVGLEEHAGDLAQRMHAHGADGSRVHIVDALAPGDMQAALEGLLAVARDIRPTLIVVDTLAALAEHVGKRLESGDGASWTAVMRPLVRIARQTDAALVILHHARRSDGAYRDSSAIGASVDVIIEMGEAKDPTVREMRAKGRVRVGHYSVRLTETTYSLAGGEESVYGRVIEYIRARPRCTMRAVREGVSGRTADVTDAVHAGLAAGEIADRGTPPAMALEVVPAAPENDLPEPLREPPRFPEKANGTKGGTIPGTKLVPDSDTLVSRSGTTPAARRGNRATAASIGGAS